MKLHVRTLSLSYFRNYTEVRIEAGPSPVAVTGENGAGKTSLLEAISLLTPGRGLRRAKIADLDNMHADMPWRVAADVAGRNGDITIGTGRDPETDAASDKRIVRIEGKTIRAHSDLAEAFSVLWLTPQMDTLFIEGNSARRKFIDRLVYAWNSGHAAQMNAYERAMRERTVLLLQGRAEPAWLSALEHRMAESSIAIAAARIGAIAALNEAMQEADHAFPKAQVELQGVVEAMLAQHSALAAENALRELLQRNRSQDAAMGRAGEGVHRTQVQVMHLKKRMAVEHCSTGEQKAALVSLILAQARAIARKHAVIPVLLLDEVTSHLDPVRRSSLYQEITDLDAQAWLTATDESLFQQTPWQRLQVSGRGIKNLEW